MMRADTWARGEGTGVLADLGDGLILRVATPADAEALAEFNAEVHREPDRSEPDRLVAAWTRDLMDGRHPTVAARDFTIVEETAGRTIVSSMCLLDQTWTYAGIPFDVGRPELVGTRTAYRNRGLVRAQFAVMHEWSARRGQVVQAITGIPYYYRQFGYEMAVFLDGRRAGFTALVPKLAAGKEEPYRVRPARPADWPLIERLYAQHSAGSLLACMRDERLWRYEIEGRSELNVNRRVVCLVETAAGQAMGLLLHSTRLWHQRPVLLFAEILPGFSWLDVAPSVLRYLIAAGTAFGERDHEECIGYTASLHPDHPLYRAVPAWLPLTRRSYAWYLRLPDVVGFVRLIAPVLEARLAASLAAGYSGDLTVSFYRSGVRLAFEDGRVAAVEPWQPPASGEGNVSFPALTFLQLLFGHRTLEELRYAFPDCIVDGDRTAALIGALFPKQASYILPLD